jgi:DinB superfamily
LRQADTLSLLRRLLDDVPARLGRVSDAGRKPASGKWSPKEELGHLLDSAANNHQRIVRVQMREGLDMPGYEQEQWVRLHAYQKRDWQELIQSWSALNRQLFAAAESVPDSAWQHTCTVAGPELLTLQFVFEDYLRHMLHHLQHIGIDVADLGATQGTEN